MAKVINIDNCGGERPEPLTSTGPGGMLTTGYLADRPAEAVLEDDETLQFVFTNRKRGLTIASGDETTTVRPGDDYRTVGVVTDRRLVVLVGDDSGDREHELPVVEMESAVAERSVRTGQLTIECQNGSTWRLPTAAGGLDAVVDYLDAASQAWVRVENELDRARQTLVTARSHRANGDYDTALSTARTAREHVETARETALRFVADHGGDAPRERVRAVEARVVQTIADVHVGRARMATDEGEERWREGAYAAAHDAFDRAAAAYEAALSLDGALLEDDEAIREEQTRLERIVEQLEQSPLRKAEAAAQAARGAEDPSAAADGWADAMAHYRDALEVDWGADERRFAGDPAEIRDRLGSVAERLTAAQRAVASDAMRAGDWYRDSEQYEAALTEYEAAAEAFERALETARQYYPDAVDHLETERAALDCRIERSEAALHGETVEGDRIASDDAPDYDVTAAFGRDAAADRTDTEPVVESAGDGPTPAGPRPVRPDPTTAHLRSLDRQSLVDVAADALAETRWDVDEGTGRFDVLARRGDETAGVVVRAAETDGDQREAVEQCASLAARHDVDSVLLVTAAVAGSDLAALAADREVRLLDGESLAALVDAQDVAVPTTARGATDEP